MNISEFVSNCDCWHVQEILATSFILCNIPKVYNLRLISHKYFLKLLFSVKCIDCNRSERTGKGMTSLLFSVLLTVDCGYM